MIKTTKDSNVEVVIDKDRASKKLSEMIKCETISKSDQSHLYKIKNIHEKYKELFPRLHEESEVIDIEGTRLFIWRGKNSNRKPIMLMSHSDVVEAEGKWKHLPFSGYIDDERVWGRGTQDTKGSLCGILEATELLIESGFKPEVDVYILTTHDEEIMGIGAKKALEYFKDKNITFELVLDEGGAIISDVMPGLSVKSAMIGVVEKGYADVKFTVKHKGGHSSAPSKDNPLGRICAFVDEINKKDPFKVEITKPVEEMFNKLSPYMAYPYKLLFSNLWLFRPLIKMIFKKIGGQPIALLKTTCAFTMASGSDSPNVIPAEASVTANLRFMLHEKKDESLRKIESIAKRYGLEMEVLKSHDCSSYTDVNDKSYKYIEKITQNIFPEVAVAPYVMLGCTDSRHFTEVCENVLRFAPIIMDKQQLNSVHGIDENIYIESLKRAVEFYFKFIKEYK